MGIRHPHELKALCARAGLRPDRASGQNFLVSEQTLSTLVDAVDPKPTDTILEVGAGFGVLTEALAPHARRVFAIERDGRIVPILRELATSYGNIHVVQEDILRLLPFRSRQRGGMVIPESVDDRAGAVPHPQVLRFSGSHVLRSPWKLTANLPYSITSDFLSLLFDALADASLPTPERIVLLLQAEVVDRLTVQPGDRHRVKDIGVLTILTHLHGTPRRIARVPAAHFWPRPKVTSAIVVIDAVRSPGALALLLRGVSRQKFLRVVHAAFRSRRKQLRNGLRSVWAVGPDALDDHIRSVRIAPEARPEQLTMDQWITLAVSLAPHVIEPRS